MGLDQNWLATDKQGAIDEIDDGDLRNIQYHRKFNALEGFMQDIWYREGNTTEFNCELLPITPEILDELEAKIKKDQLDPHSGLFFGDTEKDDYYWDEVNNLRDEVIPNVRKLLNEDKQVFYTSWW
jgi:hypothetical protein